MAENSLTIGAGLPGEQFAMALASVFKMGDDIFNTLNSPQMLALRQRQDIANLLNKMDSDLATAHKTGDVSQIDKESSG